MTSAEPARDLKLKSVARFLLVSLGLTFLVELTGGTALAWGPPAHRLVNNWAVETLPPEIRGFFAANRQFLIDHANDPAEWMKKDRYEGKRQHFVDR
jgi:hypothetical protein